MHIAFTGLPEMCSTYQAGIACIILNFVIFYDSIFFTTTSITWLVKLSACTNGGICFYHLHLRIFTDMHQAAWLCKKYYPTLHL